MVMMSLATYQRIDSSAPAAFSSKIIDGTLRGSVGYDGVVISDSLSAAAVSGIATKDLGVRLVDAGGDLACIGDTSYVTPILDGIIARAQSPGLREEGDGLRDARDDPEIPDGTGEVTRD